MCFAADSILAGGKRPEIPFMRNSIGQSNIFWERNGHGMAVCTALTGNDHGSVQCICNRNFRIAVAGGI